MRLLFALPLALFLAGCPPTSEGPTCGDETCGAGEACLQESPAPTCTNREDTGEACPDGTTATYCRGAGIPCCCEPTPEPTRACVTVGPCGVAPSCACVEPHCDEGEECAPVAGEDGVFECLALPMP